VDHGGGVNFVNNANGRGQAGGQVPDQVFLLSSWVRVLFLVKTIVTFYFGFSEKTNFGAILGLGKNHAIEKDHFGTMRNKAPWLGQS